MDIYKEKSREFFDLADYLFSTIPETPIYSNKADLLCTGIKDYNNIRTINSSLYGLICEYYLKGMLLPLLDIVYPVGKEYEVLIPILNTLSEEDKYNLLIGNNKEIINNLSMKYGIKKSLLSFLKENNITTGQHNISKIINQIRSNSSRIIEEIGERLNILNEKTVLSSEEEEENIYLLDRLNKLDKIEAMPLLFSKYIKEYIRNNSEDDELENPSFDEILRIFEKTNINNVFPEARYGHLNEKYTVNSKLLLGIMNSLHRISKLYDPCIFISNDNYIKRIYPDIATKLYIMEEDKIKMVYKYQTPSSFINELIEDYKGQIGDDEKRALKICEKVTTYLNLTCVPEYGIEHIANSLLKQGKNIEEDFFLFDLINYANYPVHVEDGETFAYYEDGRLKTSHKYPEIVKQEIDKYENNFEYIPCKNKLLYLFSRDISSNSFRINIKDVYDKPLEKHLVKN